MGKKSENIRRLEESNVIKKIERILKDKGYRNASDYLNSLSLNEQVQWLTQLCKVQFQYPAITEAEINQVSEILQSRIDSLIKERDGMNTAIEISRANIQWHSKFINQNRSLVDSIKKLSPLIGTSSSWIQKEDLFLKKDLTDDQDLNSSGFENPIKNFQSDELYLMQTNLINYYQSKKHQLTILDELLSQLEIICDTFKQQSEKQIHQDELLMKWLSKKSLSQREKYDCVLEIANQRNLIREEAFNLALKVGINFGGMNKFSSWKKNAVRVNKK